MLAHIVYFSLYRKAWINALSKQTAQERFDLIYRDNTWGSKESYSGPGSTKKYTEPLRKWLVTSIPKYRIKKVVDAPCGDFNWMSLVIPLLDIEYIGIDIVEDLISQNRVRHRHDKVDFRVGNICEDQLPDCDLFIVRDCLFHLSFEDINKFLTNIAKLDYKYLLTTNFIVKEGFENRDIITGDFRRIDLLNSPFNFPGERVLERVTEARGWSPIQREMLLFKKADVPTRLTDYVGGRI